MRKSKAFTLIELLIVIAIIGILAAMILVALNTARTRAKDARIKSDIHQLAVNASVWGLDHNNNWTSWCSDGGVSGSHKTILDDIFKQGGGVVPTSGKDMTGAPGCNGQKDKWAVAAKLSIGTASESSICVDSTGVTQEMVNGVSEKGLCEL